MMGKHFQGFFNTIVSISTSKIFLLYLSSANNSYRKKPSSQKMFGPELSSRLICSRINYLAGIQFHGCEDKSLSFFKLDLSPDFIDLSFTDYFHRFAIHRLFLSTQHSLSHFSQINAFLSFIESVFIASFCPVGTNGFFQSYVRLLHFILSP